MRKLLTMLLVLVMVTAIMLTGCSEQDNEPAGTDDPNEPSNEVVKIRYGSADAEDAAVVQGILAFKEYVEDASNGTIEIETYTNGVLGGDRELCEGLQLGTVDMTVVLGGVLGNYDPALNIFTMPYLFESKQACYDAYDGELGTILADKIEQVNFKLMGWGDGGTYHVANSIREIKSVEDMNGLKLRVPEIEMNIDFFKEMGATPTPVSFSETYTALEQGVVDGLENAVELMYLTKLMEPVDYLTLTSHSESIFPALMSLDFWNNLSEEHKTIVMEGMEVQIKVNRANAATAEEKYIAAFIADGGKVYELTDAEKQGFIDAGKKIQEQYGDVVSRDVIKLADSYNN